MDRAIEIIFIAALIIGFLTGAGRNQSVTYYDSTSPLAAGNSVYYEDVNTGAMFYNQDYQRYAGYEDVNTGAMFYNQDYQKYKREYSR
jgi:hypothetical protein